MPTFGEVTLDRMLEPTNSKVHLNRFTSSFNGGNANSEWGGKFYWNKVTTSIYAAQDPPPSPPPVFLHSLPDFATCGGPDSCFFNEISKNMLMNAVRDNPVPDAPSGVLEYSSPGKGRSDDLDNKLSGLIHDKENIEENDSVKFLEVNDDGQDGSTSFFDTAESLSNVSSTEVEEPTTVTYNRLHASTFRAEYGDTSAGRTLEGKRHDNEIELQEMRLNILMEIEKRKHAEQGLNNMHTRWKLLAQHLCTAGFVLPSDPVVLCDDESHIKFLTDISQQICVTQFISKFVGGGIIRAEVEEEMKAHIELKNAEISRLRDRLSYYESVNHEMSQRNQETTEMARQLRKKRKRQRWFYGAVSTAIALGSAALVWSFLSTEKNSYQVVDKK